MSRNVHWSRDKIIKMALVLHCGRKFGREISHQRVSKCGPVNLSSRVGGTLSVKIRVASYGPFRFFLRRDVLSDCPVCVEWTD